jgi:hypothetical protein
VISFTPFKCAGPAGGSQSSTDTEDKCRGKRYKWQKCSRPGQYGSHNAGHERGHGGVDRVHKTEPAEDKTAGDDKPKDPCR